MEVVICASIIVLTICASTALISIAKKNFAFVTAMGKVNAIVDWYERFFEKTMELLDKTMNGEIY